MRVLVLSAGEVDPAGSSQPAMHVWQVSRPVSHQENDGGDDGRLPVCRQSQAVS